MITAIFLLAVLSYSASAEYETIRYDGHSVLRVVPHNTDQLQQITDILQVHPLLDIWKEARRVESAMDFRVSPSERQSWLDTLSGYGLDVSVMIEDVQALIDNTSRKEPVAPRATRELDTSRYYDLSEIWEFLDEKVEQCGDLCEVISIGNSYEGRDLKVLKIGSPIEGSPSLWLDHGIHAREWISPAVGMYNIERLIADYGTDDAVTQLREGFNWYIHLVVNPDGYDVTWTSDRMWRKTLSDYGDACIGTDGNRNFDWSWSGSGSSSNPCTQTYHGPSAFSEIEIQSINDFVSPMRDEFRLVFTFHSYAQEMYYPWGDGTMEPIPEIDDYLDLCDVTLGAMEEVHGMVYTCYPGSNGGAYAGNTGDWAYGSMGIKYGLTLELRDEGEYGFLLPEEQILPTDEETWAGVVAMTLSILEEEQAHD